MKEGIVRGRYLNGQMSYELPYKNGKRHGLLKGWLLNKKIWHEIPLKNDLQCGAMIIFEY
jgi:antitoxin component YwqK of YwqJK toxin-antitoxin module